MSRPCVLGALMVVLVANGWSVWQSIQNRTTSRGGTLELTEFEVPLQAVAFESSATVLELAWRTERSRNDRFGPAAWLDQNKLAELGFDCRLPLNDPKAPRHYASMPPRRVFLALELQDNASSDTAGQPENRTRLAVIDADQNAEPLRQRYADPKKHGICRGVVRIGLQRHDAAGVLLRAPRLEGWVLGPVPSHISVPKPANRLLTPFLRSIEQAEGGPVGEARFSARVHWGANYEPWVDDVRVLTSTRNQPQRGQ